MKVDVRLLASLRTTAGRATLALELPPGATLDDAIAHLLSEIPALREHVPMWHLAVNGTHAAGDAALQPGDLISIFPYIAGG